MRLTVHSIQAPVKKIPTALQRMKTYAPRLQKGTKKLQTWTTSMHIGSASKFLVLIAKGDSDFFSRETGGVIPYWAFTARDINNDSWKQ